MSEKLLFHFFLWVIFFFFYSVFFPCESVIHHWKKMKDTVVLKNSPQWPVCMELLTSNRHIQTDGWWMDPGWHILSQPSHGDDNKSRLTGLLPALSRAAICECTPYTAEAEAINKRLQVSRQIISPDPGSQSTCELAVIFLGHLGGPQGVRGASVGRQSRAVSRYLLVRLHERHQVRSVVPGDSKRPIILLLKSVADLECQHHKHQLKYPYQMINKFRSCTFTETPTHMHSEQGKSDLEINWIEKLRSRPVLAHTVRAQSQGHSRLWPLPSPLSSHTRRQQHYI